MTPLVGSWSSAEAAQSSSPSPPALFRTGGGEDAGTTGRKDGGAGGLLLIDRDLVPSSKDLVSSRDLSSIHDGCSSSVERYAAAARRVSTTSVINNDSPFPSFSSMSPSTSSSSPSSSSSFPVSSSCSAGHSYSVMPSSHNNSSRRELLSLMLHKNTAPTESRVYSER